MEGIDAMKGAPRSGDDGVASSTPPSLSARREEEKGASAELAGEDEQVERFYALLANIRAMRGMYSQYRGSAAAAAAAGGDGDGEDDCRGGGPSRKRARRAEPPWRPVFRMEDFEGTAGDDAACSGKKQRGGCSTTAAKRPTEKEAASAAAAGDDDEEGEVVEGKEHRVATSQRAGPLIS